MSADHLFLTEQIMGGIPNFSFSQDQVVFEDQATATTLRRESASDAIVFENTLDTRVSRRIDLTEVFTFSEVLFSELDHLRNVGDQLGFTDILLWNKIFTNTLVSYLTFSGVFTGTFKTTFRSNGSIVFPAGVTTATLTVYNILGLPNQSVTIPVVPGQSYQVLVSSLAGGILVIGGAILANRIELSYNF